MDRADEHKARFVDGWRSMHKSVLRINDGDGYWQTSRERWSHNGGCAAEAELAYEADMAAMLASSDPRRR
jgi:hypothetical protein